MDTQKYRTQKWYQKTSVLIIAFLCVGPLALPLAWSNPTYSRLKKIAITLAMLAATWFIWKLCEGSLKAMKDYYEIFKELSY